MSKTAKLNIPRTADERAAKVTTPVWVSHGETESGDELDLIVWPKQPTKAQVETVYREKYPQEYDEVGHVCFKISEASMRP